MSSRGVWHASNIPHHACLGERHHPDVLGCCFTGRGMRCFGSRSRSSCSTSHAQNLRTIASTLYRVFGFRSAHVSRHSRSASGVTTPADELVDAPQSVALVLSDPFEDPSE